MEANRVLDTPWEMELMEGCLRVVPGFVDRHQHDDPAKEEVTEPVASGELRLVLSRVVENPAWSPGAKALACFAGEGLAWPGRRVGH